MMAWVLLNAGAIFVAAALARAGSAHSGGSRFALAVLAGYLVVVHTLVLAAGLLGQLTTVGLAVPLAAAVIASLGLRGTPDDARLSRGADPSAASVFTTLAAVTAAAVWTWPHVVQATRLWVWDDYTYHMVYPALWLREQAIATPSPAQTFTMQAWYPLSAGVVSTWFMAPFTGSRGETLAWVSLTGPLYAGLVAVGVAELCRRLGGRPGAWAMPVVVLATSSRVAIMASSFSDADLAQAAALFAAFVFAVPDRAAEVGRALDADAWYAALLSGFALGVKASAAIPALIVLAILVVRARGLSWSAVIRIGGVFAVAWLATAGYWYARNVIHTGNPLYPAAFLGRPGTVFPETTLREYAQHYGLRRAVHDALAVYLDWPRGHAVLAGLGLVAGAGWLWRRRSATRAHGYFAAGIVSITAATLIALPLMPYSAGNAMTFRSGFVHWDSMRYIALVPFLGWAALGVVADRGGRRVGSLVAAVITVVALLTSRGAVLGSPLLVLALAVAAAMLEPRPRAAASRLRQVVTRWVPAALVVTAVVAWHGPKSDATAAALYAEPLFGGAAAVLDRQAPGARVAVFGDQWIYPAFGARDQLVPVRLDGDGRVASGPIADAMEPGDLTVDVETFRANLAASGVSLVVIVHQPHPGRSPEWPPQQAALEAMPGAHLLHRQAGAEVWKLGGLIE
jgi:hypothetical protein